MRDAAFKFRGKWLATIQSLGETAMGYVVVGVV
jgi:hypothetical protein